MDPMLLYYYRVQGSNVTVGSLVSNITVLQGSNVVVLYRGPKNAKDEGFCLFSWLKVQKLQDLGYSAMAFGFFEDVQLVTTEDANVYSHSKVVQFLTALVTASTFSFLTTGDFNL